MLNVYTPKPSVFGYVRGRSIVDNARKHKRQKYVLNIDLKDFFPSINFGRVRGLFMGKPYFLPAAVATVLAQICCYENQLPQGAPTSPIVSNMICAQMDSQLQTLAKKYKCYYSRYADDMTFSTSLREFPMEVARAIEYPPYVKIGEEVKRIIEKNGFEINEKKIRLQPSFRRQEVTGLTVNKFPNVRRRYVREIRAMLHAWEKFGLANAEQEHYLLYEVDKHRNPNRRLPSFRQIVKGKIEFLGMVRGQDNPIYRRFLEKYRVLYARDRGVPGLFLMNINEVGKPQVFVEGKTDKAILMTAWHKLYGDAPMAFVVKESDPYKKSFSKGGGGGATALQRHLNAYRADTPYVVVGIFDRDREGIKAYNGLDKDFKEDAENEWKISLERGAGAMLLPVPQGKEEYDRYKNLCIEFFFSESALSQRNEQGIGLKFSYPPPKVKGVEVPEANIQIPGTRSIESGKVAFAESIVPALKPEEFEPFKMLFEKLARLIHTISSGSE